MTNCEFASFCFLTMEQQSSHKTVFAIPIYVSISLLSPSLEFEFLNLLQHGWGFKTGWSCSFQHWHPCWLRCDSLSNSHRPGVDNAALCMSCISQNPSYKEPQYTNLKTRIYSQSTLLRHHNSFWNDLQKQYCVWHTSYHSTILLYFYTLEEK